MNANKSSFTPLVEKTGLLTEVLAELPSALTCESAEIGGLGTLTVTPAPGFSRLAVSSTALALILIEPKVKTVQLYDQVSRPFAGCQVRPPSTDTSTPPTTPPPE